MTQHIMVDIETLDTANTAIITSIGAVKFDPKLATTDAQFCVNPSIFDQILMGRTIGPDTVNFWRGEKCSAEARALLTNSTGTLGENLLDFFEWCSQAKDERCFFWSKGNFDFAILEHAAAQCGVLPPWTFRDIMDVRTVVTLHDITGPFLMQPQAPKVPPSGPLHGALADCLRQVDSLQECISDMVRK